MSAVILDESVFGARCSEDVRKPNELARQWYQFSSGTIGFALNDRHFGRSCLHQWQVHRTPPSCEQNARAIVVAHGLSEDVYVKLLDTLVRQHYTLAESKPYIHTCDLLLNPKLSTTMDVNELDLKALGPRIELFARPGFAVIPVDIGLGKHACVDTVRINFASW
jgi:hypothetical protein